MSNFQINPARLAQIEAISLKSGNHRKNAALNACVMEAVSYVAGEPGSDHPECVCPVITAFLVSWNDALPSDAERDRLLKPLIPLIVGTRGTKALEDKRAYMALDWMIRVYTPKWLDLVPALQVHAQELRGLDAIVGIATATAAGKTVRVAGKEAAAAGDAAWSAAGAAAWAAARDAVGDAAWDAVGDAVGDAARDAVGDAAREAAWSAARAAAWSAVGDAAGDALKPTTVWMQTSAVALVREMIAVQS